MTKEWEKEGSKKKKEIEEERGRYVSEEKWLEKGGEGEEKGEEKK